MSRNGSHLPADGRDRRQRNQMIAVAVIVGVLAFGGGVVLANLGGNETAGPSPTAASSAIPSTQSPLPPASASATASPSASPTASASASPSVLPDGRSFVYAKKVEGGEEGPLLLTFDLAYLYTGDQATQQAAAHGDPEPTDGYYIVNDNPKLRTIPLAGGVQVRFIPMSACCELQPGDISAWADAVNGTVMSDYSGANGAWWITVTGGEVVKIEEQYFP